MIQGPRSLDLADDKWMKIQIGCCLTDGSNVCGTLYEGLTDCVETLFLGERQPALILLGEGSNAKLDVGKIQPFLGTEFASDEDPAPDLCPNHLCDLKLDETVVEVQPISGLYRLRQPGEADRDPVLITDDIIRRQGERIANPQPDRLLGKLTDAHFRPGQVRHDGKALARRPRGSP